MTKKILYYFGGVIITLFLFLTTQTSFVLAAEGECHLKHCLVPAPTILMPSDGDIVYTSRPEIRGLSWKTTIVKVYVDGNELENVQFKKHEDYYGSFFVIPNYDLSPGEHYIYTIAHSEKPGWFDQSKESTYIDITVKKIVVQAPPIEEINPKLVSPVMPDLSDLEAYQPEELGELELPSEKLEDLFPQDEPEELPLLQEEVLNGTEQDGEAIFNIVDSESQAEDFEVINIPMEGEVDINEGKIEGGVFVDEDLDSSQPNIQEAAGLSDLGELLKDEFEAKHNEERRKRNRLIGLVMLAVILVFTIIWLTVERQNKKKRELDDKDEGELPPPPQPPQNRDRAVKSESVDSKSLSDDDITIEPIKEEIDLMEEADKNSNGDYWASPPPSPYSPYPTSVDLDESDEKQNDLGI